jgi:hypothetical protein
LRWKQPATIQVAFRIIDPRNRFQSGLQVHIVLSAHEFFFVGPGWLLRAAREQGDSAPGAERSATARSSLRVLSPSRRQSGAHPVSGGAVRPPIRAACSTCAHHISSAAWRAPDLGCVIRRQTMPWAHHRQPPRVLRSAASFSRSLRLWGECASGVSI